MRLAAFFLTAALIPAAAQVRQEDLVKGPGVNWLTYAGGFDGKRHSPLTQITTANAGSITAKWVFHVPKANGLRTHPVVYDGIMYVTAPNTVFALDAATGRQIWMWKDTRAKKEAINRGVALLGDRVFFCTADVHLVALDRRTGNLLWQKKYGDIDQGIFASAAPLAVKDRVLAGVAGGDTGMRGYIAAFSASTGEELWRTYTIPGRGEPGSETWNEKLLDWGGAATWLSGTYDPELNLLYWTTGNAWPDFYGGNREGDNLYTSSLLALDLETGKLKWHFQFTPHDVHDWDAQSWPVLIDMPWNGQPRKLVFHANRNGFWYVLDRVTGEYLRATKLVDKLDWATGVDAKGRPILVSGKDPTPNGNVVCPGVRGATNWMSPSFNPATGWFYIMTVEQCDIFTSSAKEPEPMKGFSGGGAGKNPKTPGQFVLRAFDPKTGERKWEYPMTGPMEAWPGTLSTAGGLIFSADDDGNLIALNAKTGQVLWHFNMGETIATAPITYSVNGKQYVSIASATAIFTFGLFEAQKPIVQPAVKIIE